MPTISRIRFLARLSVVAMLGVAVALPAVAADDRGGKLRGELPRVVEEAGPDELIPVSIILADQLSGPRLLERARGIVDRDERRRVLAQALKGHAERTQVRLLGTLSDARLAGRADNVRPLWIGNIVAAELTAETILAIAGRAEVSHVNWAPKVDVFLERPAPGTSSVSLPWSSILGGIDGVSWLAAQTGASSLGATAAGEDTDPDGTLGTSPVGFGETLVPLGGGATLEDTTAEIECGTDLMGAPRVWNELGNTGEGAVIAVIDSGVCWSHPDIVNQIWVNPGEDLDGDGEVMDGDDANGIDDDGNGYVDDFIGYDIDNGDNDPNDNNSHGSHVAGTVAGDGTSGTQAGMAPDAEIMVLRVGLSFSDEPDVWEAMQYAADNGADSISMSLGWPHNQNPDRATWRQNCENVIEMGTAMVIAAGNEGQGNEPDNVRTPGDVPRIISVGATDCSDNAASFTSRGPVEWANVAPFNDHPYPPGLIKPDVSGPGVSTKSHNICSGYSNKSGTSMATPHVAGAVAMMVSANPGLTHDDIKQILQDTSIDLGPAGMDNTFGTGRVDAYEAVLASQTSDGRMSIQEAEVRCAGGTFNLVVSDQDLVGAGTITVDVHSDTEPTPETITLTETSPTSGVFKGTITTAEGAPAADGILQVGDGDLVTATYVDADDGNGGFGIPKTDEASTDCGSPLISEVHASDFTDTSAVIRWTTDEPGDSRVTWGENVPPTNEASQGGRVTSHAVTLTGLTECTVYWYRVSSADVYGNDATDDNGGDHFFFETWGDFGNGLQPCHAGQVSLAQSVLACDSTVDVEVVDLDLNLSTTEIDTATLELTSSTEIDPETIVVTETDVNSSKFTATVTLASGAVVPGDGVVQTSEGDILTATYHDADNGTGSPAVAFATSTADCVGAGVISIRLVGMTDESAQVRVETSELTTVSLDWGTTPALGTIVTSPSLSTVHTLDVAPLTECGRFYFDVATTDAYGNGSFHDAAGSPFEANAFEIPGAVFKDGFESDAGWTLEEEWEFGVPQGLGSSPGDPAAAYSGNAVLGHDLSGQGTFPGDYEPGGNTSTYATSPVIDASALANGELKFRRWLNVGGGGIAYIEVKDGNGWTSIWNSDSIVGVSDSAWSLQTFDVSQYADGENQFQVRFRQANGFSGTANRAGWNVDRVIVRDGSLPEFAACGGCGGAPTFGGLTSAVDADPCSASGGVDLAWSEVPAWGTGAGGTFAIYRDTTPGFTPSGANLVASGVAGLSYNDATAPDGQDLYYLVRAETDETCSTGPNNGGQTDGNAVYLAVTTTATQPLPGAITALSVGLVNDAHVRLAWPQDGTSATYRVYRSDSSDPATFSLLGETAETVFEDANQVGNGNSWYYDVRGADTCGNE